MSDRSVLLIATANAGKWREIANELTDLPVKALDLSGLAHLPSPEESAPDLVGNACIKALHYARLSGLLSLADDSGLQVEALDGAPGVRSARYAGPACSDVANNAKLLEALRDVPDQRRTACFVCQMVLADAGGLLEETTGRVRGRILREGRGENGFGYDPLFLIPSLGKTLAELTADEKNRISHRGLAARQMAERLVRHLRGP